VGRFAALVLLVLVALPETAAARSLRAKLRKPSRGVQVRMSPFTVPAHGERELCQAVALPDDGPLEVREVVVAMPGGLQYGSHHFVVFLDNGPVNGSQPSEPVDSQGCSGMGSQAVSPILVFVQHSRDRVRLPRRVGIRLARGQRLLLNSHYVNGSDEPLEVDVAVNFRAAPRRSIDHHVRTVELGTFDIDVPAGGQAAVESDWTVPFPMNLVMLTSHSHKFTQAVEIAVARGGGPFEPQLTTLNWEDPAVVRYPRPLRLEAGDVVRWTCHYDNPGDQPVGFGLTTEDEMCFTIGFFYPDDDAAPLPEVPYCFGGGDGLVCPFN
jgi:hypothetical protein